MLKAAYIINDRKKNNNLVIVIKSGLSDLNKKNKLKNEMRQNILLK